jgi:N-acetyltransferase
VGLEPDLWRWTTLRLQTPDDMLRYIETALAAQRSGTALPFAILLRPTGEVVGSTRYHSIAQEHRRLEVGFSWVGTAWHRTAVNSETKYLLLRHAFESLGCVRVQFKTTRENERSKQALARIGATEEGTLRQFIMSPHGDARDATMFSIIDREWPSIKTRLEARLAR